MKKMENAPAWGLVLRRIILAALVLTAGVMALAEYHPSVQPSVETAAEPSVTPEPDRRSVREEAYDKDVAALRALVEHSDEATREQAADRLERMVSDHQTEIAIEEALRQAGYAPKLVLMQNNALTIMLDGEVSSEVSASVLALCAAYADVGAENVRIMGT